MAKTEWTVFFGQRDAGNQKPVTGWKEKELKVAGLTGSTLEKNTPAPNRESAASIATCSIQQAFFVTVEAESGEEACLVVDRVLSQGLNNFGTGTLTETAGGGGPSIKPFVDSSGKAFTAKTSNIEEIAVR